MIEFFSLAGKITRNFRRASSGTRHLRRGRFCRYALDVNERQRKKEKRRKERRRRKGGKSERKRDKSDVSWTCFVRAIAKRKEDPLQISSDRLFDLMDSNGERRRGPGAEEECDTRISRGGLCYNLRIER